MVGVIRSRFEIFSCLGRFCWAFHNERPFAEEFKPSNLAFLSILDWVTNLHFLVSVVESDLDDDYTSSLCSVYSGPPDHQLMSQNGRIVWFPCTLKPAKYLKIIMYTQQGQLTVSEFEIYVSVVTPAPSVITEQIPEHPEPGKDGSGEG